MSNYKNPFVKLECLPHSFIEGYLTSGSFVKEQPEEKNENGSWFAKPEKENGRPSNSAKVNTYSLIDISKDDNSVSEHDVSGKESNYSEDSDNEDKPNFKLKVKTNSLKDISKDNSSVSEHDVSEKESKSNYSEDSDNEDGPNFKPEEKKEKGSWLAKPEEETGRPSRSAKLKVKTYNLKDKDDSSVSEHDVSEKESNFSEDSKGLSEDDSKERPTFKRKAKKRYFTSKGISDSNSSDRDSTYSQDSDREFRPKSKQKIKKRKATSKSGKSRVKQQKTLQDKELTEYEKLVQKNKEDKMAFLQSLKINEVKEGFSEAVKGFTLTVKPKREKRPKPAIVRRNKIERSSKVAINLSEDAVLGRARNEAKKALREIEEEKCVGTIVPLHKIAHSSKVVINLSEDAILGRAHSETEKALQEIETKMPIVADLPAHFTLKNALNSNQRYELYLCDTKGLDQGCTEPIERYESRFNDMNLLTPHIKTFMLTHITALDIHPMREKTLIAVGAGNGSIYLWNMTDLEPYAFELHSRGFYHLKFNPEIPHLIMCCNRDGLLRKGDLVSNVYDKVTNSNDCTYFDFLSPETCLVAHRSGYVTVVDMRAPLKKNEYKRVDHQCHENMLRSISVHPVNKNEFITPTNKGCVRLWDLRKLRKYPIREVSHSYTSKALNSAIYSPLTGKSVLTSSADSKIWMSDTASWTKMGSKKVFHRKLSCPSSPSATWQPRTDDVFAVANDHNGKSFDIYNRNNRLFNHSHGCIKASITSCTFHPSLPIIAAIGGNKVFPFADKNLKFEP